MVGVSISKDIFGPHLVKKKWQQQK